MTQKYFKKSLILFLLFVTVGAFFFCAFAVAMPMSEAAHNAPMNQEKFSAHFDYVKDLTLATIVKAFIASISFILLLFFIVAISLNKLGYFFYFIPTNYLKQKCSEIFHIIKLAINYWLSFFERSSGFLDPA